MKKTFILLTTFSLVILLTSFLTQESLDNQDKTQKIGNKVGNKAPEIELYTSDNKLVTLSSLRGKMVLVEFWASWCSGCRVVNKQLRPVYNKYHNQKFSNATGFYILSISLDTDRKRWINAIEADSIQYTINVCDLNGFDSKVAKDYKLGGLPTRFLIDGNGIIVMDWRLQLVPTLEQYLYRE